TTDIWVAGILHKYLQIVLTTTQYTGNQSYKLVVAAFRGKRSQPFCRADGLRKKEIIEDIRPHPLKFAHVCVWIRLFKLRLRGGFPIRDDRIDQGDEIGDAA